MIHVVMSLTAPLYPILQQNKVPSVPPHLPAPHGSLPLYTHPSQRGAGL